MDLYAVVTAIVAKEKITEKDIEKTVLFLTEEIDDVPTLRRIVKKLNAVMDYENS